MGNSADLFIVQPLGNQMEDLKLQLRQSVFLTETPFSIIGRLLVLCSPLKREVSKIRGGVDFASVRVPHDLDELGSIRILQYVTDGSSLDRGGDLFIIIVDGKHE